MKAIICGVTGQDGAYLARLLLKNGYEVVGTSRKLSIAKSQSLRALGITDQIELHCLDLLNSSEVQAFVEKHDPQEIYNLAGLTSVGLSFEMPCEAVSSITIGTLNLLEAIKKSGVEAKYYNAGSGECFGETNGRAVSEQDRFNPRSPYAVAKVAAHNLVKCYRDSFHLHACTGMLFNHESPLRPHTFVTQKIVSTAAKIKLGLADKLMLGNLDIYRDWGWAEDYVDAMWRMTKTDDPQDLIIATGRSVSLRSFAEQAFSYFELNYRDYVVQNSALFRPSDIAHSNCDPTKAQKVIGWKASKTVAEVIEEMCVAAFNDAMRTKTGAGYDAS